MPSRSNSEEIPPAEAPAHQDLDQARQKVRLRHHLAATVVVVDLDVLLDEPQPGRVRAVEALSDHDQLGDSDVDDLGAGRSDAHELALEVELLEGLDTDLQSVVGEAVKAVLLGGDHAVAREEADARRIPSAVQVHPLDPLQVAAEQDQDRRRARLESGGTVEHLDHVGADPRRVGRVRRLRRRQQRDDPVGDPVAPAIVDELDVMDRADDVLMLVVAVDDLVRDDVAGDRLHAVEAVGETKERAVGAQRHTRFTVALEHHPIDQSELVVEILADVPMHAEEGITAHLHADGPAAHRHRPQHGHHVGPAQTERQEVWVEDPPQGLVFHRRAQGNKRPRVGRLRGAHLGLSQLMPRRGACSQLPALLPPAPRQLVSGYVFKRLAGAGLLCLAAVAVAAAYAVWQWSEVQTLQRDQRLWAEGEVQAPAEVEGQKESRDFILNSYKLNVRFADEDGVLHSGKVDFDLLFSSADEAAQPAVRYHRGRPDEFALNWAAQASKGRWASFAFMTVVGVGLIGGSLLIVGIAAFRTTRAQTHAARVGVEVECVVSRVDEQLVNGRKTGSLIYVFLLPEHFTNGGPTERQVLMNPKKGTPILLEGGSKLIALVDPSDPRRFLVVRNDFFPIAVA